MKYIIERSIAGDGITWVKSDSFPLLYTQDVAESILDEYPQMDYRISPVTIKPYRRHAAVSQLELRGAIGMLSRAMQYSMTVPEFDTWAIFADAKLAVTRQMETL
jgi:hypothetical protein